MLQVRPKMWSGPTDTGPVAEPSAENNDTSNPTGSSGLAIHVLDRSASSHRKASSPRPTTHETHTIASQKHLEGTQITRKGDPYPKTLHRHLK